MPDYFYDMDLVVDPLNPANVVAKGQVAIYDPADVTGTTLLALTDPSGLPLPNPLTSNANGFLPPRIAQVPQTMWKSGGFTGYFNSYKGLRDEAVNARDAALAAAANAADAANAALAGSVSSASNAADAAQGSASSAAGALAAAAAAQAAAESAAAAATGGGYAVDPDNPNVLLVTTRADGSVAVDPTNSNVLLITT